jgi:hypothetical protein
MNCEFTDPVNLGIDSWAYSKASCELETLELIESGSTTASFYVDKRISYGDVIIFVFLSLFTIAIICKEIGKFVFNRQ